MDILKGGFVGVVLLTPLFVIVYKLIRRFANSWWIWGAVATSAFFAMTMVISPVFISPLFNTYKPLEPGPVRDAVLLMARSNGIPADEIWQFDASKQSDRVSANVSGLWGTTRISLNDNLLKRCDLREIRAVMGHEMGHYVMNHVLKTLVFFSVLWLVGFAFLSWASRGLLARHGAAWGVRSVGDIASLPVTVAALTTFVFLATPIFNTIIRTQETEADMFGLNLAREPDGMAEVALKLSEYRKMSPSKFEEFIFFDHPSGESRIRAALTWKEYLEKTR
jgi:STE24 endopeptidase